MAEMAGVRIYADYNGLWGPEGGPLTIPLDTRGSLRDLTNAGVRLRDGIALTVIDASDDDEDLEADATARYDTAAGVWLAVLGRYGGSACGAASYEVPLQLNFRR